MNLMESVKIAFNAIWINKMRSLLTMLGIIIGISSVIAIVALGSGAEQSIGAEFEQFGANRIAITTNWEEKIFRADLFTDQDIEALKRAFPSEIDAISVMRNRTGTVINRARNNEEILVSMIGVEEDYLEIARLEILVGRFLLPNDVKARRHSIVIDDKLAINVFGRTDVIGERLLISTGRTTTAFTVVGIYETPKSMFADLAGFEQPSNLYIPISTLLKIYGLNELHRVIEMNLNAKYEPQETMDRMISLLERRRGNTDENKYIGHSAEGQLEIINNVMGVLTGVISAIAAISLLVGGIGVMNIMLVSVTERTREIGIRKALGAKHRDIMTQFLVEAVIISGIGGAIGTTLGIVLSYIIAIFVKVPPSTDFTTVLIAVAFSAGVGIFFGLYPANKAAKLDPIEALRYE
ncbi:MAG: ABC transporter permease [Clostridiales bacterium]|nr:ABC transporter permease [Clostridiales bacterium]